MTKSAATGITDSKLDESVLFSETKIQNYNLIYFNRNKHRSSLHCFIGNDTSIVANH